SIITLCLGGIGIVALPQLQQLCLRISKKAISMEGLYFRKLSWLNQFAIALTSILHNGSLGHYTRIVTGFIYSVLLVTVLIHYDIQTIIPAFPTLPNWVGIAL